MRGCQRWRGVWQVFEPAASKQYLVNKNCSILRRSAHDGAGSTSLLKTELRRLYKLIHPDLLQNLPDQQATNLQSFQLLQEYLNAAKGGGGSSRFVYHFKFYIQRRGDGGPLDTVEVSIPAPQARRNAHEGADILPATRKYLGQLLSACGLSGDVSGGLSGNEERTNLAELLQQASELQRQSAASRLSLQQQISMVTNTFRLGRGVVVILRAPVLNFPLTQQVELLQRLASALDKTLNIDLSGCTIAIGNSYQVDALGCIWLNYLDTVEFWANYLRQVDLLSASARRLEAKARQQKEVQVARLMGVSMVFTNVTLRIHHSYSWFLNRVGDEAAQCGPVGGGKFHDLPVCVGGDPDLEVVLRGDTAFFVDEIMGYVTVPVWADCSVLYKFIQDQGEKALQHRRKLQIEEQKLEDLRKHVIKNLRLRYLTFDERLSTDQLMSACTRLSSHARKFGMYTEGLSVHISDEYRLPTGESQAAYVHLKWNFSLKDL